MFYGMVYDNTNSELFGADNYGKRVVSIKNGVISTVPRTGLPTMDDVRGIHIDSSGRKFVLGKFSSQPSDSKIILMPPTGDSSLFATVPGAIRLYDITGDTSGNLFVTSNLNFIYKVDSSGTVTPFAGTGVSGVTDVVTDALSATLNTPWGIDLDHATGDLFFACRAGNRLQMIRASDMKLVPLAGGM